MKYITSYCQSLNLNPPIGETVELRDWVFHKVGRLTASPKADNLISVFIVANPHCGSIGLHKTVELMMMMILSFVILLIAYSPHLHIYFICYPIFSFHYKLSFVYTKILTILIEENAPGLIPFFCPDEFLKSLQTKFH